MASLIPGYEYDVFISYRQKDNKGDMWVSGFVEALKTELESTFKDEISVYFDINPHDGLLESHNVDKSLESKLKCLVFIPIISKTYCDIKSFAWQNEFCAFNRLAKQDQLGSDIKLDTGNVAGRILPVKIHDLDKEDTALLLNELGAELRAIEFIFKAPGVNRPLTPSDNPYKNQNQTLYRDQINKVANAVQEIIRGIKYPVNPVTGASLKIPLTQKINTLTLRKQLIERSVLRASFVYVLTALIILKIAHICTGIINLTEGTIQLITLVLIVLFPVAAFTAWQYERSPKGFIRIGSAASLGNPYSDEQKKPFTSFTFISIILLTGITLYLIFPQTGRTQSMTIYDDVEKSIAVLPFINDSHDGGDAYFFNGIMEEIHNNLEKIKAFNVLSLTSTDQFKGSNKLTIREIAKKLKVNYIVEASGRKYGNTIRLSVQLIAANPEKRLWSQSFKRNIKETSDIVEVQSQIAQIIASELKAKITPEEKQLIEKTPTRSLTAYDFYQRGHDEMAKIVWPEIKPEIVKKAELLFRESLKYDSTFARAWTGLADVYWKKTEFEKYPEQYFDSMLIFANTALSYDDNLAEAYYARAGYYWGKGYAKQALAEFDHCIKYNPNFWGAYSFKGFITRDYDVAKSIEYFNRAATLNHGSYLPLLLKEIGWNYRAIGFPETGNYYYTEALKLEGDSSDYINSLAHCTGDYLKALHYYNRQIVTDSSNSRILSNLVDLNLYIGRYKESLGYIKRLLSSDLNKDVNLYPQELYDFGYSYFINGYSKESQYYFNMLIELYHNLSNSSHRVENVLNFYLAGTYACLGDKVKTYEYLKLFNQKQNLYLEGVIALKNDPRFDNIRHEPEFQKIMREVEAKYLVEHERVGKWMAEYGNP